MRRKIHYLVWAEVRNFEQDYCGFWVEVSKKEFDNFLSRVQETFHQPYTMDLRIEFNEEQKRIRLEDGTWVALIKEEVNTWQ